VVGLEQMYLIVLMCIDTITSSSGDSSSLSGLRQNTVSNTPLIEVPNAITGTD
jgi:hypothetical protein